jgi:hypothetical protein
LHALGRATRNFTVRNTKKCGPITSFTRLNDPLFSIRDIHTTSFLIPCIRIKLIVVDIRLNWSYTVTSTISLRNQIMSQVIRIPADVYSLLEKHANGFDTPVSVIERVLDFYERADPNTRLEHIAKYNSSSKTRRNTVDDWKEHFEIVMGYRSGETNIGTPSWSRNIYQDFCNGNESFGATSVNAMEAVLLVVSENDSDKYEAALNGLKKTIEAEKANGRPLVKLGKMYERVSGRSLHE